MKKFFATILMAVIILAMCGCEEDILLATPTTNSVSNTTSTTPEETSADASAPAENITPSVPEATEPMQTEPEATVHIHSYTSEVTQEATCAAEGIMSFSCACGDAYTETTAKLEHSYTASVVDPTCTENGYTLHTCDTCGDTYQDSEVVATGHSYTGEVTTEATCTAEGVKTYTCHCGDSYTENIAKLEHNYKEKVTAPTCTAKGYTKHTCRTCGYSYKDSETPATGHSYTAKVTAPTCVDRGYTTHTCACGDSYKDNYTDATGIHSYGDWTVSTAHSCTQDEISTRTCKCGYAESKVTKTADHSFGDWAVEQEATCSQAEVSARTCIYCKGKEVAVTGQATGEHQFAFDRYCEVCNLKEGHEAPIVEPHVFDVFTGELGIYEYKNLLPVAWYNDHNPAWIRVFATEQSEELEAEVKAKFQEHFGYTPNEAVVCTYVGDYFLDGQTTATSVYQYTITDNTYTLLDHDFCQIYTQLCSDGSAWVGYALEGNLDTMTQDWALVEESREIFCEWTGYTWEEVMAGKGTDFWVNVYIEAGTMRTLDGELVQVTFCFIRGINKPVDTPPPID